MSDTQKQQPIFDDWGELPNWSEELDVWVFEDGWDFGGDWFGSGEEAAKDGQGGATQMAAALIIDPHGYYRTLRWAMLQGARPSAEPELNRLAALLFEQIRSVFAAEIEEVRTVGLYSYEMPMQGEGLRDADAQLWRNCTTDGSGTFHLFGIASEAIEQGSDYSVMVLLHELAHAIVHAAHDHDTTFHTVLDGLIDRFNRATGSHIANDYDGL